jgi:hypothetical protein
MPIIKRQAPLLGEGEYVGQAKKVTLEWSKPKSKPDGTKSESVPVFRIPLHTHNGGQITTFARVLDTTGWVFEQIVKSGELIPPDSEEFVITPDDLEGRRFYFGVKHVDYNGAKIANVHFHTQTYACQVNPALENVTFSNEAPRGIPLRSAAPPKPSTQPPETPEATAPKSPTLPQPPASDEAEVPPGAFSMEGMETLSDEEFQQAIDYTKQQRAKKEA